MDGNKGVDAHELASRLRNEKLDYWLHVEASSPLEKYPAKQHARRVADIANLSHGLIFLAGEISRNNVDSDMPAPFRQRRYFYYLSGCNEPDCSVAYDAEKDWLTLFIPRVDPLRVIWYGRGSTPDEAMNKYDIDEVRYTDGLSDFIFDYAESNSSNIYVLDNEQMYPRPPPPPGGLSVLPGAIMPPPPVGSRTLLPAEMGLMPPIKPTFLEPDRPPRPIAGQRLLPPEIGPPPHIEYTVLKPDRPPPPIDRTLLQPAMNLARVIKDDHEIGLIRKANEISSRAHREVLASILDFGNEAEVEGLFLNVCVSHQAKKQAYDIIAASGPNAGTLHYAANNEDFGNRQLMCLDAGCEWQLYASDITRTFPLSREWPSKEAEQIYRLVEKMQESCIERLAPGVRYLDLHIKAHQIAIDGLLALGILHNGTKEEIYKAGTSTAFFPHGLGHHVGLEVHDVGQGDLMSPRPGLGSEMPHSLFPEDFHQSVFDRNMCRAPTHPHSPLLQEGMVVTVEPGIYFSQYALEKFYLPNIIHSKYINVSILNKYLPVGGVRIEDDVLITAKGHEVLTTAPKGDDMLDIIRSRDPDGDFARRTWRSTSSTLRGEGEQNKPSVLRAPGISRENTLQFAKACTETTETRPKQDASPIAEQKSKETLPVLRPEYDPSWMEKEMESMTGPEQTDYSFHLMLLERGRQARLGRESYTQEDIELGDKAELRLLKHGELLKQQRQNRRLRIDKHQELLERQRQNRARLGMEKRNQELPKPQNKARLRREHQNHELRTQRSAVAESQHKETKYVSRTQAEIQAQMDYTFQLMLLEQQNKKRLLLARQEQEQDSKQHQSTVGSQQKEQKHPGPESEGKVEHLASGSENKQRFGASGARHPQQDYQMQLVVLEQQNKKRLLMARQEQEQESRQYQSTIGSQQKVQEHPGAESEGKVENPTAGSENKERHAQQDYQMQLMVLEQQNKKRLLMARQEQASANKQIALQDYEMQLMLLEQQNKKRLLMARQEQDGAFQSAAVEPQRKEKAHPSRAESQNAAENPAASGQSMKDRSDDQTKEDAVPNAPADGSKVSRKEIKDSMATNKRRAGLEQRGSGERSDPSRPPLWRPFVRQQPPQPKRSQHPHDRQPARCPDSKHDPARTSLSSKPYDAGAKQPAMTSTMHLNNGHTSLQSLGESLRAHPPFELEPYNGPSLYDNLKQHMATAGQQSKPRPSPPSRSSSTAASLGSSQGPLEREPKPAYHFGGSLSTALSSPPPPPPSNNALDALAQLEELSRLHQEQPPQPPRAPSYSLYVTKLDRNFDNTTLATVFREKYPSVTSSEITRYHGVVRFGKEEERDRAAEEMEGVLVGRRRIHVDVDPIVQLEMDWEVPDEEM